MYHVWGCNEHAAFTSAWQDALGDQVEHVAAHGDEAIVKSGVVQALSIHGQW